MRRRRIVIGLFALAGAVFLFADRGGHAPQLASALVAGSERTYACELALDARTAAGALVDVRTTGTLALTVIAAAPELVVRAHYSGATLSLAGSAAGADVAKAAVERALGQPFYLTYRADSGLASVRTERDTPPFVAGLFRALGSAIVVRAPEASTPAWQVTETDAGGAYIATYRVTAGSEGAARHVQKQKERYLDAEISVIASRTELAFDDRRELSELRSNETVRSTGGTLPDAEVTSTLSLRYLTTADRTADLAVWTRDRHRMTALGAAPTSQETFDHAAVAGWRYSELLATLRAYALEKDAGTASKDDKARAARAYAALTALLRLHPAQLADVREHILENGPLANTLIAALRDAGSPEAQQVLADLLADPRAADRRPRLARGLSLVAQPTAATVEVLRSLEADAVLGVQATYGLGSALHRLRDVDQTLASGILAHLRAELANATTIARTTAVLGALGNAGHPGSLDALEPFLRHADEQIRAAAADALRRIPGPRADELVSAATHDASATVRARAIDAIARRPTSPTLAAAVAALLVGEREFLVRSRAVHVATGWLATARAILLAPLQRVSAYDPSADLRRIADAALRR